jgi:hypothetical protein
MINNIQFVEEQAIDRVHRLNQTVDVTVYKLTIKDTVEQRIVALQEKKRALAAAAIEGKAVAKLGMDELLSLFRREAENDPRHEKGHEHLANTVKVLGDGGVGAELRTERILREDRERREEKDRARRTAAPVRRAVEHETYGRRW